MITHCQCLDFVEASHRRRAYPLMYCRMDMLGRLDVDRLKRSVLLSSKAVPEILYAYNFKRSGFVDLGHTPDDAVRCDMRKTEALPQQDLTSHPQLQIFVVPKEEHTLVIAAMSHILTDGQGFLQYLYLLAALYNGGRLDQDIKNVRDVSPLLENIRVLPPTEQARRYGRLPVPALRSAKRDCRPLCLTVRISDSDMELIRQRAKRFGVALNDVFMTAYARVIARLKNISTVVLPCPADLRRFHPGSNALTVANMTGTYRKIAVEVPEGCSFSRTLQQVHIEMELQKSRYRCFEGIQALNRAFYKVPRLLLKQAIKAAYRLPPVSYTNFGVVDHEKLRFKGCTIENCFLTGTYRLAPDFQLTVSTFQNKCTLNCTLMGGTGDEQNGRYILEQVRGEILRWIEGSR